MKITIVEEDLIRMVKQYIEDMGIPCKGKEVTVSLKANRKKPSYAIVNILEEPAKESTTVASNVTAMPTQVPVVEEPVEDVVSQESEPKGSLFG